MKTWIVCVEENTARLFHSDDPGLAHIESAGIIPPDETTHLEKLCDKDVGGLVLCGNPDAVSKLCQGMSDQLRSRILGIVPNDLSHASLHSICERSRTAARGKMLQPRRREAASEAC